MNIVIVGLGLIGGSYAKSISRYTEHKVYTISHNNESISRALNDNAIVGTITNDELCNMDMVIVSLPPAKAIEFMVDNIPKMKEGAILTDICGVKKVVSDKVKNISTKYRVNYISVHPMAGRECTGYVNSLPTLFQNRSLIIIDNESADSQKVALVEGLHRAIGFSTIVHTTPSNHDRIIAYTSQMCHITSNAFVKSMTSREHNGYSGGSFEDLTRVAFLDPKVWVELFSMNRDNLLSELRVYIKELKRYEEALDSENYESLRNLLQEGRDIKESITVK